MAIIKERAVVPYTPAQMYDLVNDIAAYPDFLEWCARSEVISHNEHEISASLFLQVAGMEKSFTTRNSLHKNKMIEMRLVDGPFKHLEGFWRFESHLEGTEVSLDMEFEFISSWLNFAIEPLFCKIASSLVNAFSQRAKEVYAEHA